ncbi:hypothetical protein PR048_010105 [Dryococelus australis]|uniref:Uncharacterized protein n=1 Tax=Dryococelus australis TaxID=614101 RepID=A0ABQ9I1S5_9NEOP|nr:hypothetical protein PR048_010105 [Dryococelus australis]
MATPEELQHRIVQTFQQMKNDPGLFSRIRRSLQRRLDRCDAFCMVGILNTYCKHLRLTSSYCTVLRVSTDFSVVQPKTLLLCMFNHIYVVLKPQL